MVRAANFSTVEPSLLAFPDLRNFLYLGRPPMIV